MMERNQLNLPLAEPLVGRKLPEPNAFVADDAIAVSNIVMKPTPGHHVHTITT